MKKIKRTGTDAFSMWWWTIDKISITIILFLMAIGIFMIGSSSITMAERINTSSIKFVIHHVTFLTTAILIMIFFSFLNTQSIRRICIIGFIITLFLLIMVFAFGIEVKGAKRWIKIIGFSLQPSEFIKPFFAITNAWILSINKKNKKIAIILSSAILIISISLIISQPDIGMTTLIISIWIAQIFVFGIRLKWMMIFILMLIAMSAITYKSFEHVHDRIKSFISKSSDTGYQVKKSLESFHNGGIFGVGPAEGKIKLRLPDAHTDFIFAVIAEELGMLFCTLIIILFLLLIYRFYKNTISKNETFIIISTSGLIVQFALQVFINIGTNIKILPAKGMTLPFISYGGSSAISTGILFGILFSFSRKKFSITDLCIV